MTDRDKVTDARIRAYLASRTAQVHAGDLLDEIGRRSASVGQVAASRSARPARTSLAMALALIVVLAVGIGLLRPMGILGPGASPAPSVRPGGILGPSPSIQMIHPSATLGAPALGAGMWRPSTLAPPITFMVPGGVWVPAMDTPRELSLTAFLARSATAGALSFAWLPSVYTDPCQKGEAGPLRSWVGETPAAFIAWLKSVSPVDPGSPRPVSVGGYSGLEVTFTAPARTDLACAGAPDHALTLGPNGGSEIGATAVGLPIDNDRVRVAAVVVNGTTFLAITSTADPIQFDVVATAADAVIASLAFR